MKNRIFLLLILLVLVISIGSTAAFAATKLSLAHEMPAGTHQYHQAALHFADLVKEKTNGEYEIEVYPSALMGSGALCLESCSMGTLDFSISSTSHMAAYIPRIESICPEGIVSSWANYWKFMLESPFFPIWSKEFTAKTDVMILGMIPNGEYFIASTRPVTKIEDLKGMKWRGGKEGSKKGIVYDTFFGTTSTGIEFSELYTSFKTNVINGCMLSVANYKNSSLYEVAPYCLMLPLYYASNPIYMSGQSYRKIPDEYKQAFIDAGEETRIWIREKYENEIEPEAWAWLKQPEKKVTFYYPTEEEERIWRQKMIDGFIPKYIELWEGADEVVDYYLNVIEAKK